MRVAAVLTAAGSGTRLGSNEPKALVRLQGEALVLHAARRLIAGGVGHLVVTCPPGRAAQVGSLVGEMGALCVEGGPTRQASVAAGLRSLPLHAEAVLVHDAARALASPALVRRLIDALADGAAAVIPALPVVDTIKRVQTGIVTQTVDRSTLVAVQTPQGFAVEVLRRAHERGSALAGGEDTAVSDDAGLVERFTDVQVRVVAGEDQAMKITTQPDLLIASTMLESGEWV